MKLTKMKKVGVALAAMMLVTTANAYDPKYECAAKITNHGQGDYFNLSFNVVDKGHRSYKVTGKAYTKKDNKPYPYTCKIRHGEVIDWRVNTHSKNSDKAVAIGAGLLAIAAIVAANNDKDHNNRHKDHATGGSAFDDIRYLKKQCRKNIRHHISNEDEPVKRINLNTTHLHNRTLVGEGGVLFRRGGGSDISYECKFDRQGRIYDGHYRFH